MKIVRMRMVIDRIMPAMMLLLSILNVNAPTIRDKQNAQKHNVSR